MDLPQGKPLSEVAETILDSERENIDDSERQELYDSIARHYESYLRAEEDHIRDYEVEVLERRIFDYIHVTNMEK